MVQMDPLMPFIGIRFGSGRVLLRKNSTLNEALDMVISYHLSFSLLWWEGWMLLGKKLNPRDIWRCKGGSRQVEISHLQFTNVAFFIGKWSWPNFKILSALLLCFQSMSGIKINLSKRKFYGIGIDNDPLPLWVDKPLGSRFSKS